MAFKLENDIIFFDLETTGVNIVKDRIVQIGMIKVFADGSEQIEKSRLVNPEMLIPKEAMDVHGITDEMVENEPAFKQIAKGLADFMKGCDLGGFNSNSFDIPLLCEEFSRAGVEFNMDNIKFVDSFKIFQKMEKRDLTSAYKFYCGKKLENAHDAIVDIKATIEVFKGQLKMYKGVSYEEKDGTIVKDPLNNVKSINDFTVNPNKVDMLAKFIRDSEGTIVYNFGKHKNKPVISEPGFVSWMLHPDRDFATETKNIARQILNGEIS